MNHQLAVETRATERYMLDELDQESRSAFEEHYFSCYDCAADVKAAAVFVDNAKAVLLTPAFGEKRQRSIFLDWRWMAPAAALAACLVLALLAPFSRGQLMPPMDGGIVTSVAVPAGTRGAQSHGRTIAVDQAASIFQVRLDVADDVTAPRLLWTVKAAGGRELRFQTERENRAVLPLRAADFPPGHYELILSADASGAPVVDRYPFTIVYR